MVDRPAAGCRTRPDPAEHGEGRLGANGFRVVAENDCHPGKRAGGEARSRHERWHVHPGLVLEGGDVRLMSSASHRRARRRVLAEVAVEVREPGRSTASPRTRVMGPVTAMDGSRSGCGHGHEQVLQRDHRLRLRFQHRIRGDPEMSDRPRRSRISVWHPPGPLARCGLRRGAATRLLPRWREIWRLGRLTSRNRKP